MSNNRELVSDYVALARSLNHQTLVYKRIGWSASVWYTTMLSRRDEYMAHARTLKGDQPK